MVSPWYSPVCATSGTNSEQLTVDRVQALRFFQAHNHERIHRLIELASPRHGLIIQLLPLLFHINSKVLPGYISDEVPAGLIDYRPDKTTLDKARELENSFKYRNRALRRYPLRGLYLLNPQGLLSVADQPKAQVWLLHSDTLTQHQRQLVMQKLEAICDWATASGLQLDYKLLSGTDLKIHTLNGWESDLFYSCGMVLGGSLPYWWLTSPQDDQNYQQAIAALQSQRMLNQASFIDLGAASESDATRHFDFVCEAITDSLQHGTGLLELLYLQTTLQQAATTLSSRFKQQVYQQQTHVLTQDINYLKLQQIEQKNSHEDARGAFYLASDESLSKPVKLAIHPWRRDFIKELTLDWGWDKDKLQRLDQRDYAASKRLYQQIGHNCKVLLNQLIAFVRHHNIDAGEQLTRLHKLHQLRFKPAADVIDCLPDFIRPATNSERLYLQRFQNHSDWILNSEPVTKASHSALFRHDNLMHVLGWAVNNHILSRSNWLSVIDQHQTITTNTVVELTQQLLRSPIADSDLSTETGVLTATESISQLMLFCNLQQQPNDKLTQQGLQLSSKHNDPLNYTAFKHSLVMSIDGLVQSTQGHWHSFGFNDHNAPLELLVYLLNWQPAGLTETAISGWCSTAIFGQTISQRLVHLAAQVCRHYQRFPDNGRLLINFADRPYSLQWHEQAEYIKRPVSQDLWQTLAENRHHFVATCLDNYLDSDGLLNYLLRQQSDKRISVFIYLEQNTIICYLIDELGNLIRQQFQHLTESTLIAHLHKFLTEIKTLNQVAELRFYRLRREQQSWQLTALAPPKQTQGYLPISVTMSTAALDANCTIVCGQKSFTGRADERALFNKIHKLVLSLRKHKQHYPVYLNSLKYADGSYHATAVYMQQKHRLEQLFNLR